MIAPPTTVAQQPQRLIFLNRFFFPDHSATSQVLSDLAFQLAARGRDVHVITSRQLYNKPQAALSPSEDIHGVHVHRIATTHFGRKHLLGRGMDYLSFFASSYIQVLKLARPGDIVVVKTDPPLLSIVAMHAVRRKQAHLANWLQDLYPEVAESLDVPLLGGRLSQWLKLLRNRSLKRAAINVVVGERMAAKLIALGAPPNRTTVIPNWSDDETIVPVPSAANPLRADWQLVGKFVVGYSGNLGRAHEFDTILAAAEQLRDVRDLIFLFIGGGHSFDELARCTRDRKLEQLFRFLPYQDRSQLKYSLSVPDVHLLSLRPEVEGLIVPSKFYGIAAAGRPMLALIAKDGEFAPLIERYRCGVAIEPGRGNELARAIMELSSDPSRCRMMGRHARVMLEEHFTKQRAFERWKDVLARLAGHSVGQP